MPTLHRGIAQTAELVKSLDDLARVGIPGVVKWRYTLENDWSGDDAIFFWVVLADEATGPGSLRQITSAFRSLINKRIDPLNNWGLLPYFSFRSQS